MTDHGSYILMAEIRALKERLKEQEEEFERREEALTPDSAPYAEMEAQLRRLQFESQGWSKTYGRLDELNTIIKTMEAQAKETATQYSELWKELQGTEKRLDASIRNANQKQDQINEMRAAVEKANTDAATILKPLGTINPIFRVKKNKSGRPIVIGSNAIPKPARKPAPKKRGKK